jgi:diaminohydroxyphosphoribosylaminopyrimidine deaminase/5-amino-6-(5-phosphoribosylamino)uracil reductase
MDHRALIAEAVSLTSGTHPHPNPRVGALVLDRSGSVVGRGAHHRRGEPHAEVLALREAGERAAGGTIVVTLEPCGHEGATPPCTAAILGAGVARVVVGAVDPDPRVSGAGLERLRKAGLDVIAGVDEEIVESADPGYFHHRRTGRPRVTLKWASTIDGQVAAADGSSQWITSEDGRRDAHQVRAEADAIMVGAGTLLADDPLLTVRHPGAEDRAPLPVVVSGRRDLPRTAQLWERDALVIGSRRQDVPVEVVVLPGAGGVDLGAALDELGRRQVVDLLVEGGPTLIGSLLRAGLADRGVVYVGGRLAGGTGLPAVAGTFPSISAARPVVIESADRVGPDLRIEFAVGGS